ncbi:MAG: hypothetical protein WBW46_18490 [Candidatus Sulfotelmatobacter sp.]
MQRRSFLKGAGIVTILVAGGAVWRAEDQGVFNVGQGPAYAPWKDWQKDASAGPLRQVRSAILAASPHNTQPWLFRVSSSGIELYADTTRNTGALDPYRREQHIALGCALENLMLAADANGYNASATLLSGTLDGNSGHKVQLVARVELAPGMRQNNELYNAIPNRHTNRNPYDPKRLVPSEFMELLSQLSDSESDVKIFLIAAEADRKRMAEVISAANNVLYADPEVKRGSKRWIRIRWSSVQKYRDGLTIDAAGLAPMTTAVAKFVPLSVLRWMVSEKEDPYLKLLQTPTMFGIIAVRDRYDQQESLRAGRVWQRAHLLATSHELAARPANEAVEMVDHERKLGQEPRHEKLLAGLTGDATWQPTFTFYMGYPIRPAAASPRRSVQDVVL